jgi:hypothetical protein
MVDRGRYRLSLFSCDADSDFSCGAATPMKRPRDVIGPSRRSQRRLALAVPLRGPRLLVRRGSVRQALAPVDSDRPRLTKSKAREFTICDLRFTIWGRLLTRITRIGTNCSKLAGTWCRRRTGGGGAVTTKVTQSRFRCSTPGTGWRTGFYVIFPGRTLSRDYGTTDHRRPSRLRCASPPQALAGCRTVVAALF